MTLEQLAQEWRSEAERLRSRYSLDDLAKLCDTHAAELQEAIREAASEELTLAQAARESGYSERRLRELVAEEKVPNAGELGRPRIRRGDLPRKARPKSEPFDAAAHAAGVLR